MGGLESPEDPVIFTKPWGSLSYNPKALSLPIAESHIVHHEIELGVYINKRGSNIPKEKAMEHIGGYFLLLDITDRNLQNQFKKKGLSWQLSKGQDNFCPITDLFKENIDPYAVELHMKVNDETRQKEITRNMNFKIDQIISYVSKYMSLTEGDLILTGTPSGVGPLKPGDKVLATATHEGKIIGELNF